jgi:hypothetical protein
LNCIKPKTETPQIQEKASKNKQAARIIYRFQDLFTPLNRLVLPAQGDAFEV